MTIENNVLAGVGFRNAVDQRNIAIDDWVVRDNLFSAVSNEQRYPYSETDSLPTNFWLSDSVADRNWLRPRKVINKTRGRVGALPPGPAPPEGDWFTRLLDRWRSIDNEDGDSLDSADPPLAVRKIAELPLAGPRGHDVLVSPDGKRVYVASEGVQVFSLDNYEKIGSLDLPAKAAVNGTDISADGKLLAAASGNDRLRYSLHLFDASTLETRASTPINTMKPILRVAISPDSQHVAVGTQDIGIVIVGVKEGNVVRTFGDDASPVFALLFSKDGGHLLSGSGSTSQTTRRLQSWDWRTGESVAAVDDVGATVRRLIYDRIGFLASLSQGNLFAWHGNATSYTEELKSNKNV